MSDSDQRLSERDAGAWWWREVDAPVVGEDGTAGVQERLARVATRRSGVSDRQRKAGVHYRFLCCAAAVLPGRGHRVTGGEWDGERFGDVWGATTLPQLRHDPGRGPADGD